MTGKAEATLGFSAWTGGGVDGTEGGVGRAGLGRDGGDGGEGSFGSEGAWAGVTCAGMAHSQTHARTTDTYAEDTPHITVRNTGLKCWV